MNTGIQVCVPIPFREEEKWCYPTLHLYEWDIAFLVVLVSMLTAIAVGYIGGKLK